MQHSVAVGAHDGEVGGRVEDPRLWSPGDFCEGYEVMSFDVPLA